MVKLYGPSICKDAALEIIEMLLNTVEVVSIVLFRRRRCWFDDIPSTLLVLQLFFENHDLGCKVPVHSDMSLKLVLGSLQLVSQLAFTKTSLIRIKLFLILSLSEIVKLVL
jgi:hypothetical protein